MTPLIVLAFLVLSLIVSIITIIFGILRAWLRKPSKSAVKDWIKKQIDHE